MTRGKNLKESLGGLERKKDIVERPIIIITGVTCATMIACTTTAYAITTIMF